VAEHNTEVGNKNNTGILPRKSKHMDQLVTEVRDQAAPQQHKLGGHILQQIWKSLDHFLKEKGQPQFSKNGTVFLTSVNTTFPQY
jgi:hypothetical protein